MNRLKLSLAASLVASLSLVALVAQAQPHERGGGGGGGGGGGRERMRDDHRERRDVADALKSGDAGAAKEIREEMRKTHRTRHLVDLQRRYGDALKLPGVKDELKVHARRMARLRRINTLAHSEKKEAVQKRVEEAMHNERARHDKKMLSLGVDAGPSPMPHMPPDGPPNGGAK